MSGVNISDFDMQALYHPQDDSYFSAAAELLEMRNAAIKDELASNRAEAMKQGMGQRLQ